MSKILFVNRCFWPDSEATGLLLKDLTEDLAVDHEITVICGPANTLPSRRWPLFERENYGPVKVVRTCGMKLSKKNLARRVAGLGIYWVLALIAALRERPDVIVTETDPPLLGLLGAAVKRIRGCRFVYHCQDVYPDIAEATHGLESRLLIAFLGWCNQIAYRKADAIVALAGDMAARLLGKGVNADRIVVIPNWIDCRKLKPQAPSPERRFGHPGDFVVMYAGNLGWSQKLETVLHTARLMRDDLRVKFVLVGDGARKSSLEQEARVQKLDNVEFVDRQDPSAMSEVLAAGNLQLVPLTAGAAGCLVPSKLYWILAAGKPFVAMMEPEAEVARVAANFEVGFVTPPGDAAALARTISASMEDPRLLEEMGRRARALAEQEYDRALVTHRFAKLLQAVLCLSPAHNMSHEMEAASTMAVERAATVPAK